MEAPGDVIHVPYSKMSESTAAWSLDAQTQQKFKKTGWCVTEKIHGANCCWITDGKSVRGKERGGRHWEEVGRVRRGRRIGSKSIYLQRRS
jgi:hypothetical protein